MLKHFIFIIALALTFLSCQNDNKNNSKNIEIVLDNWHLAATNADLENYFSVFTDDVIYIGTDASERWTKDEYYSFCKPHFDKGKTWDFKAYDRKIYFSNDGETAWFNELLKTWMGPCRASGVLIQENEKWKISHYHLSITVKNENMKEFLKIKGYVLE